MTAAELIALLDGRATDDTESLLVVQEIIDTEGVDAAMYYWLHGETRKTDLPIITPQHWPDNHRIALLRLQIDYPAFHP